MNTTTTAAAHTVTVRTIANHGTKARRAVCSCGALGVRYAFAPGARTVKEATAKAEADAAKHLAGEW